MGESDHREPARFSKVAPKFRYMESDLYNLVPAVSEIEVKFDCSGVNWEVVSDTLRRVGMAYYEPSLHKKAFKNSYVTVFVCRGTQMIGFGRAISDGAYQAAIYDVAVIPDFPRFYRFQQPKGPPT